MDIIFSEPWVYLFIFFARVFDISLDVIRILMLMREKRLMAALVGFVEVTVFLVALSQVIVGGLNDPLKVIAYAGGFATGNFIGSLIDSRLAIGHILLQVFTDMQNRQSLCEMLREQGFGVTTVNGWGRDGEIVIINILLKRKDLGRVLHILDNTCPQVFYNITESKSIRGGIFPGKRKAF